MRNRKSRVYASPQTKSRVVASDLEVLVKSDVGEGWLRHVTWRSGRSVARPLLRR